MGSEKPARKRRLHGLRVMAFLLVAGLVALASLVVRIHLDGQRDERGPADVIIVLGAAQYNGKPSQVYQARLDHALMLYHAGLARYMLFTGGKRPADRVTEAETGRAYAREHGVPDSAIFLEEHGRTTWQSLQTSTAIMSRERLHTAILVSDPFHALRLRRMARDLGMQAHVSPASHSRIQSTGLQWHYVIREMSTYALYRMLGM